MIMTGMVLNLNVRWEELQLRPQLQNIIRKYREFFEVKPVDEEDNQSLGEDELV